jgi:5-methylcytosine-specific restriction endonuclease McrA
MGNPRRANGHRRDQVRARVLREESDCWLCGKPVDKTLGPYLSGSPEVDEVIPVSLGGSPIDRNNCRLAHRLCNVRRGNGTRASKDKTQPAPFTTARQWGAPSPTP